MPLRKVPITKDELYHIYNKSIAEYKIFNSERDYERIINEMRFYSIENPPCKFSIFEKIANKKELQISVRKPKNKLIDIIAYCIMPTHMHFVLKELKDGGIIQFINLISKSYSKYFNVKYRRKGPLWESRFKNILIKSDEQLIHLTRYIHLNPVTAFLINDPCEWKYSSYKEYIGEISKDEKLCDFSSCLSIEPQSYIKFVNEQIDYQRELAFLKHLIPYPDCTNPDWK